MFNIRDSLRLPNVAPAYPWFSDLWLPRFGTTLACPPGLAGRLGSTGAASQLITVDALVPTTTFATDSLWQHVGACWSVAGGHGRPGSERVASPIVITKVMAPRQPAPTGSGLSCTATRPIRACGTCTTTWCAETGGTATRARPRTTRFNTCRACRRRHSPATVRPCGSSRRPIRASPSSSTTRHGSRRGLRYLRPRRHGGANGRLRRPAAR